MKYLSYFKNLKYKISFLILLWGEIFALYLRKIKLYWVKSKTLIIYIFK